MGLNKSFKEFIKDKEDKIFYYYNKSLPILKNKVKVKQDSSKKKNSKKKLIFK
tara:strand:- start:3043 stop:3201 length:159 start_codon:yes stop_codon:yes gene_type:complete